jgi:hypothetical protein
MMTMKRLTDGCGARNGFGLKRRWVSSIAEMVGWMGGSGGEWSQKKWGMSRLSPVYSVYSVYSRFIPTVLMVPARSRAPAPANVGAKSI